MGNFNTSVPFSTRRAGKGSFDQHLWTRANAFPIDNGQFCFQVQLCGWRLAMIITQTEGGNSKEQLVTMRRGKMVSFYTFPVFVKNLSPRHACQVDAVWMVSYDKLQRPNMQRPLTMQKNTCGFADMWCGMACAFPTCFLEAWCMKHGPHWWGYVLPESEIFSMKLIDQTYFCIDVWWCFYV